MSAFLDDVFGSLMLLVHEAGGAVTHDHWLGGFMPHGHCYLWNPNLLLLHTLSDGLIALAYFCIPVALITFMRRRKDLAFPWMFILFSAFIVTCGMTHLMEIYTVYVPAYWSAGVIKAVTAIVSIATAILLLKLVPRALALPSPEELRLANEELRKSNIALRESDEALREAHEKATAAILERISDGFVTFDRDWRCVSLNSAAARFFRKSPEELLGKVLWDVYPETERLMFGKEYRRAMDENVAVTVEDFYPEPLKAWFEMRCYPSADGLSVFFSDITERKATEQRLRQLSRAVEQSPSPVMITDTQGNIEYVNPRFTTITGYSFEEVHGKNPRILKSGALPPETYKEMWETICAGREWRGEFYNKKKTGEFFWEAASICPITDENGVITHFLGVKEDITERKTAERAVLEAKHLAEQANQAKDDFIAALSHELRTPLTPVLLTVSALQDEKSLSPDLRNQIDLIRHNVQMEARLIDDLLDVSKIAHGKISLQSEAVDISALLSKALEIMREDIVRKGITIQVESGAQYVRAYGDPARLQQVFWNLLKNAAKFTPSGGSIHVRTFNPDPRTLWVEFRDTGIGIAPEFLEKIFRPFEQGAASGNHRYGGLGLGLSISKAIVGLHGGTLSAASGGLNHGATFTVGLPVSETAHVVQPPLSVAPVQSTKLLRILLVEDDENTRMVLSRLLTRDGHHVEAVGTCAAAIQLAKAAATSQVKPFEALVCDIGLPDGSGLDIARAIKALTPEIKAIALSGYGTDDDIRNSMKAGFHAHLTKPISFGELRRALAA